MSVLIALATAASDVSSPNCSRSCLTHTRSASSSTPILSVPLTSTTATEPSFETSDTERSGIESVNVSISPFTSAPAGRFAVSDAATSSCRSRSSRSASQAKRPTRENRRPITTSRSVLTVASGSVDEGPIPVGPVDPPGPAGAPGCAGAGDPAFCANAPVVPDSSIATTSSTLATRLGRNVSMASSAVDGTPSGLGPARSGIVAPQRTVQLLCACRSTDRYNAVTASRHSVW